MKKAIAIIATVFSILLILESMDAYYAFAMFMLAGVIPGTNITLSASFMFEFFSVLLGFALARVSITVGRNITNARLRQTTHAS